MKGMLKPVSDELKGIFKNPYLKSVLVKVGGLAIALPWVRDNLIEMLKEPLKLEEKSISFIKAAAPLAGIAVLMATIKEKNLKLGVGLGLSAVYLMNLIKANVPQIEKFVSNDPFEAFQIIGQEEVSGQNGFKAQGKISDEEITRIINQMEAERQTPDYSAVLSSQQKGFTAAPAVENKNPFLAKKAVLAA